MIQTGNRVRFSYIESPNGQLPPIVDDSTIYMLQDSQQLYVGNHLIAASEVSCNTTAGWTANPTLVGKAGHVYIYSDHQRSADGDWSCDPEYYFDAPFQEHLHAWWAPTNGLEVNKLNTTPCICLATTFKFPSGLESGGIIFLSPDIDGTEFQFRDHGNERYITVRYTGEGEYDAGGNLHVYSNAIQYNGQTWYYCVMGCGGNNISSTDGTVTYIPHLHDDRTYDLDYTSQLILERAQPEQGYDIPGFKVGDGQAYLVDLPFADDLYARHILNSAIHVSAEDRASWSNKITCYIDPNAESTLVFSTN